jgi:hypothetical protein
MIDADIDAQYKKEARSCWKIENVEIQKSKKLQQGLGLRHTLACKSLFYLEFYNCLLIYLADARESKGINLPRGQLFSHPEAENSKLKKQSSKPCRYDCFLTLSPLASSTPTGIVHLDNTTLARKESNPSIHPE